VISSHDDDPDAITTASDEPGPPSFNSLFFPSPSQADAASSAQDANKALVGAVTEPEALPAFSAVVGDPAPSSSASAPVTATAAAAATDVVADTKAALPRDTKEASSKDLDDGEPPPPYTEGSSPLEGFNYIMATAGGPASIITQVQQQTAQAPGLALGGIIFRRAIILGTRF
jgi:ATP-binding cassette subfamily F protein 3